MINFFPFLNTPKRVATKRSLRMYFFFAFLGVTLPIHALEVHELEPPQVEVRNIKRKILCHRPMRRGAPAMFVEKKGKQTIIHNYGHGGSGWTIGPGCVNYVLDKWLADKKNSHAKDQPITVIGAGVIGLFTAFELHNRGYTNITIVADRFDALTSHNAGGLLAPVSMDNTPELQKVIDRIGIEAYRFFEGIAKGKNTQIKDGAVIVPSYFSTRKESGLEPYVNVVMRPAKDVEVRFVKKSHKMVVYEDGIYIDTEKLIASITTFLKKAGVRFKKQHVKDISSVGMDTVFNCSGFGSKKLTNDANMVSVQGHLIMLKNQKTSLPYMILVYLNKAKLKSGFTVKRSFYVFPKSDLGASPSEIGVLGGTFIEGADARNPHTEEYDQILKQAREFFGYE